MRTKTWILWTLLSLLLTSGCMPDSFTKFEEDEPTASSSGGSTDDSSDDSSDDDSDDDDVDTSDIVYTISSVDVYQSADDVLLVYVSDVDNFRVGDDINIAQSVVGPGTYDSGGTITGLYSSDDDLYYIMAIQLSSLLVSDDYYLQKGNYIDNCSTGYGNCATGSTGSAIIDSDPVFYVPSTGVSAGSYNFQKHIEITGTSSSGYSAANLEFDYSFSPEQPQGIGIDEGTSGDQTDDEIVSPYGPFLPSEDLNYLGDDVDDDGNLGSLTVTVSINESFYGDGLDDVETSSVEVNLTSNLPTTSLEETTDDVLYYHIPDSQQIAVKVNNISGYAVGDSVVSCRTSTTANCSLYSDGFIDGAGTIYAIDLDLGVLYITTTYADGASIDSRFPTSNYIYDATENFLSAQTESPRIIITTSVSGWSVSPIWNDYSDLTDDPSGIYYAITDGAFDGIAFSSSTGVVTITGPEQTLESELTITAYESATGEEVSSYVLNMNAIGTATALYAHLTGESTTYLSSYAFQTTIDQSDVVYIKGITSSDFPSNTVISTAGEDYGLGVLKISLTADGDGAPFAFPTGAVMTTYDQYQKQIDFTPSTYIDGTTTYELSLYHPALSGTTVIDTINVTFESGSSFESIYYPQYSGDKLILTLDSVSYFEVGDLVVTDQNSEATITYIDSDSDRIFVTINSDLNGDSTFKVDDTLDTTNPFVSERATISSIVRVYDVTDPDNRFTDTLNDDTTEVIAELYDSNGDLVTPSTGEVSWAISPSLPSGLTFYSDTGIIEADTSNSLPVYSETEFTISATNSVGDTATQTLVLSIGQSPSEPSLARYQFIRLNSNNKHFYRGSKVSSPEDEEDTEYVPPTGRVLFPVDIDGDGLADGMLLENFGNFEDGLQVDNTASYFAAEGYVQSYQLLYVEDVSGFSLNEEITTSSGAVGTILDTPDDGNNVLYVKVKSGTFAVGQTVTDSGSATTKIKSIEDKHYVSTVVSIPTASTSNYQVGETVTSSSGGTAAVVQVHYTGGSYDYILLKHISGDIAEGDTLTDSDSNTANIYAIIGPNVKLAINPGTTTSSRYVSDSDEGANPLFEGMPISQFAVSGNAFVTSGYVVAGTDYSNNELVVNVEDYRNPFYASGTANTYYLDDTSVNDSMAASLTSKVRLQANGVSMSNLMIGYVGELFYLDPSVQGEVAAASIQPETLPDGLSFDSTTGLISGTPTEAFAHTDYTVSFRASNGASVDYDFSLVVYNQFEISQLTEGASSYIIHKEGRGYSNSRCKVFGPQVIDDVGDDNYGEAIMGFNDIICYMDGGEADIYTAGINFQVDAGGGMCEYVEFVPYSYKPFLEGSTLRTIVQYNDFDEASSCGTGDAASSGADSSATNDNTGNAFSDGYVTGFGSNTTSPAAPNYGSSFGETYCVSGDCISGQPVNETCGYDHSAGDDSWINADEGYIRKITVSCSYSESEVTADLVAPTGEDESYYETDCSCTYTEEIINCDGDTEENFSGAKVAVGLSGGEKSQISDAYSGLSLNYELGALIDMEDEPQNSYYANYTDFELMPTAAASCFDSTYLTDTYDTYPTGTQSVGETTTNRYDWSRFAGAYDPHGSSDQSVYSNYYVFNCLDSSYNVKARVRVVVRDWDSEVTPDSDLLEQLSPDSSMDVTGINGFGESNDSRYDIDSLWLNLLVDYGSSSARPNRASCSATAAQWVSITGTETLTLVRDVDEITISGSGLNTVVPVGSVIRYTGSDGTALYFMVRATALPGEGTLYLSLPSYVSDSVSGTLEMARRTPYPMQ